jgi:hypothetical protein
MENWRINMIKTLTPVDIRDLPIGFAAAIELDQMRVDALPSTKFHRYYNPTVGVGGGAVILTISISC